MPKIDSRGWFSVGLFALAAAIFIMLDRNPDLANNPLFATLAQAIVITGLINMAAGFNFGAAKEKPPSTPPETPPDPQP